MQKDLQEQSYQTQIFGQLLVWYLKGRDLKSVILYKTSRKEASKVIENHMNGIFVYAREIQEDSYDSYEPSEEK